MKSYSRRDLGRGLAGAIALSQIAAFPGGGRYAGAAPWYDAYAIGGTSPQAFADFTTEGATNHYLWGGDSYSSGAAWLTAVGGTYSNSTGKYVTNASGLLASVAANTLPFNHDGSGNPLGLLLEGASTNLTYQSNAFTTTPWVNAGNVTLTSGAATGPDGTASMSKIVGDGASNNHDIYQTNFGVNGQTYTVSVWGKTLDGTYIWVGGDGGNSYCIVNPATGAVLKTSGSGASTVITTWANGCFRIQFTFVQSAEATGVGTNYVGLTTSATSFVSTCSTSNGAYIFGYQAENFSFASSYIPTTSSTASRAADSLYLPWTATTFTARIKATLAAQVNGNYLADTGHGLLTEAAGPDAETSNGTQTLTTGIAAFTSSNIIVLGGSSSGRVLSANGNAAASDSNALVPSAGTEFYIGQSSAGGNQANGNYAQVGLWNVAATAAQAATNSGTA